VAQFPPIRITIAAIDRVSRTFRKIEGRTSVLRSKLAKIGRTAAVVSGALLSIGSSAAYAGTRLVTGFIDKASGLVDAADRIGITASRFQELALAAEQVGVTQGQLELAMRKFVKEGGKAYEFATKFADGIAGISDENLRARVLVKALGKSGQALGPLFKNGSRGIAAMVAEFHRLGSVQDDDTLRRAESLGDAFARIKSALGSVVGAGFSAFLPDLERGAAAMEKWLGDANNQQQTRRTFAAIADSFSQIARSVRDMTPGLETIASVLEFRNKVASYDPLFGSKAGILRGSSDINNHFRKAFQAAFDPSNPNGLAYRPTILTGRGHVSRIIVEAAPGVEARVAPGSSLAPGVEVKSKMGPVGVGATGRW
jgi:hypothetical protein